MNSSCLKTQVSQHSQLPVLPPAISHLLKTLTDEHCNNAKLKTAIEQFPSIAARLLFLANSAWAAPPVQITTLDMACARLGLNIVRSVSIALAIASPFNPARCPVFNAERHWCTSLLVADGAAWLASSTDLDSAAAHTAGLLHNLGLLWLADNRPLETAHAFEVAMHKSISLNQALQQSTGTDYCEVGGYLGKAWGLPDSLVAAMKEHCNPNYDGTHWHYAALVKHTATVVSALYSGETLPPEKLCTEWPGITQEKYETLFIKTADQFESTREMARTLFPG